jgi:hypothetical protein
MKNKVFTLTRYIFQRLNVYETIEMPHEKMQTEKSENFMKFIQYIPFAWLFPLSTFIRGTPAFGGDTHLTPAGNRKAAGESAPRLDFFYSRHRRAR